jgi:signal transduction histidine kinase/uncharacterized protein YerC
MPELIPSSIGAVFVVSVALFMGVFQAVLALSLKNEPWNKWGAVISFTIALGGVFSFFQFYLGATKFNYICEQIQISCVIIWLYACYRFTIRYLDIKPTSYKNILGLIHLFWFLMIWKQGLIINYEFVQRNFLWLSKPLIEPELSRIGLVMLIYSAIFALYIIKLWIQKQNKTKLELRIMLTGCLLWSIGSLHDIASGFGFVSVHYLSLYGFLCIICAIFSITILKHLHMHQEIKTASNACKILNSELEEKVEKRTTTLAAKNEQLLITIKKLKQSEKKTAFLSEQVEQFSLTAASMLAIRDKKQFFDKICTAIVQYSDYKRVLISLFKDREPFRDIIGYKGISSKAVDRLRKVDMPASQYDNVFKQGISVGVQSYYIPHLMKDLLKQEATIYANGVKPQNKKSWHPEDNLFVEILNEQGEFTGVISVDDSKSGLKPTDETVRPLEFFSNLISYIIVFKKEQAKAQKLEEQLMQARKMEALGTLTGGIAHDFNNILAAIIGNAELVMAILPKTNKIYSNIESIKGAGYRATGIVKQLLSFGKKSDGTLIPVAVNEILQELQSLIKSTIPATVKVETIFEQRQSESVIMADPVQINQVFLNLCLNAAQSMHDQKGVIKIFCNLVHKSEKTAPPKDFIQIIIADNGPGISPDIIDRIFDPYFTTKDVGKGSGIGLFMVHGIIKDHNGDIEVKSTKDKGTSFKLLFPVVQKKSETILQKQQKIEKGKQETILVVDDDLMVLEMMEQILNKLDYKVTACQSPARALEKFASNPDNFDLVITDMTMPEMTGTILIEKIVKIAPKKPVILCTGYNDTILGKNKDDLKVAALLTKPVKIDMLAKELKIILNS